MAEFIDHFQCAPYVTEDELLTCCKVASDNLAAGDPRLTDAIDDASLILYYLTGRQFGGVCEATVRPCVGSECVPCHSCKPNQIDLGYWPVTRITAIRQEGSAADVADFHIDSYRYLVRNDGEPFPYRNNMSALPGSAEDNADDGYVFEVTVEYGMQVPRLMTRATRALACELVQGCLELPCKLPTRVNSLSRQGVSMDVVNPHDLLINGRTGIYEVDLAIAVLNPSKIQSPSFFWSGQQRYGRRTNT